jgi:hypothetical protein
MSLLEAMHGDPVAALDYRTLAIRNYHDAGSHTFLHPPLDNLATLLDRLGHFESVATIAGFANLSPLATTGFPELGTAIANLRNVLGEQTYQAFARTGGAMTTTAVVAFTYDQIDQARTSLAGDTCTHREVPPPNPAITPVSHCRPILSMCEIRGSRL